MISNLDSAVIDANCESMGISISELMTNAGTAVSSLLKERFHGKRIAFVCGNGNNGGDGIFAAGMMPGENVTIYLLKPIDSIKNPDIKERLSTLGCSVKDFRSLDLSMYEVLVDCALGTGIKGGVKQPYEDFIKRTKEFSGIIVSVDVPSGLGTHTHVNPSITITFHDMKEGMNKNNSGEIIIADIGIPSEAYDRIGPGDMVRYPVSCDDSHKGSNGRLLIIGGGPYYGAPAMSALAALRIGVDIVRLAVPESCYSIIAGFSPVFTMTDLEGDIIKKDHVDPLLDLTQEFDAVLIGPGAGTSDETRNAINDLVSRCTIPMVIDADGLTALGPSPKMNGKAVLTPHRKEFERLGGNIGDKVDMNVKELAKKTNSTILLKGPVDIVSDGNRVRYNDTGTPGMTGAGTGDVLAGIVAGLLAKGMNCFDSASLGAFISGKAGEYAFDKGSYGMIATDVIDEIPNVLKGYIRD